MLKTALVAPARERGLKLQKTQGKEKLRRTVAPARERGLKWFAHNNCGGFCCRGRSRKGAWIEILTLPGVKKQLQCRSRKGAWIEIVLYIVKRNAKKSLPQGSVD